MAIFPKVICRRCKHEYAAIFSRCPNCGARRPSANGRAAVPTDAAVPNTPAYQRASAVSRWQNVFGGVILSVVIIAVIILVSLSLNGRDKPADAKVSPIPSVALPSPTIKPTPSPTPTIAITSLTITYGGNPIADEGFTLRSGHPIPLKYIIYPVTIDLPVTWSSTDESIITVSEDGVVTYVSDGTAWVILSCGGVEQPCRVIARR